MEERDVFILICGLLLLFVLVDAARARWRETKQQTERREMRAAVTAYLERKYEDNTPAEELEQLNKQRWD